MRIEHSIDINAPIGVVWGRTVDIESWPQHTTTITSVERIDTGPLGVGSQARLGQPGQRAKVWTVTVFEPERSFAWASKLVGQTMTGGHHLASTGQTTTNTLTLDIEGRLAPLIGALIKRPIEKALATENAGIKAASEAD